MKNLLPKCVLFFVCLQLFQTASGQQTSDSNVTLDIVSHYQLPQPYDQPAFNDPELKNLVWNKWNTENFTILSLDAGQGKYLHDNIEKMKKWVFVRWGLPDVKFSAECRVICVPDKKLMKKLFRLEQSHGEVRRKDGIIEMSVLWLVLDQMPAEVIPCSLTLVCLSELENQGIKVDYWAVRGMSILNKTIPQIEFEIGSLQAVLKVDDRVYFSQKLLSMTEADWKKETLERRQLYDREAAVFCLLLRKEFGQSNLLRFIKSGGGEQNFNQIYGFSGYREFDATFNRYMIHLSNDVIQKRCPSSYLQITEK